MRVFGQGGGAFKASSVNPCIVSIFVGGLAMSLMHCENKDSCWVGEPSLKGYIYLVSCTGKRSMAGVGGHTPYYNVTICFVHLVRCTPANKISAAGCITDHFLYWHSHENRMGLVAACRRMQNNVKGGGCCTCSFKTMSRYLHDSKRNGGKELKLSLEMKHITFFTFLSSFLFY